MQASALSRFEYFPAGHEMHDESFVPEYFPAPQIMHVFEPAEENSPGSQRMQATAPSWLENFPAAQLIQDC